MTLRDNIVKIEVNQEEKSVELYKDGRLIADVEKYLFLKNQYELKRMFEHFKEGPDVSGCNRFRPSGDKEFNKAWSDYLGMPVSLWRRKFNGMMYDLWVKPVEHYSYLFRGMGGRVNMNMLCAVSACVGKLNQAVDDGNKNITPFIALLGLDASGLKKHFGKSLWKKLCKNSMTRNLYIARCAIKDGSVHNIGDFNQLPSCWLKRGLIVDSLVHQHLLHNNIRVTLAIYRFDGGRRLMEYDYRYVVEDTLRMSRRLGENFNPKWSLKKMQEKHDEYTREIQLQRYPKTPFPYPEVVVESEKNGVMWKAVSLNNPYEVYEEGLIMKQCVASYGYRCSDGVYRVFRIYKNGEHYSTLGCDKKQTGNISISYWFWDVQQHYMKCNKRLEDDLGWFEKEIIERIGVIEKEEVAA